MNWDFFNKAPPWLIIVMLFGSGGGVASLGNLFGSKDMKTISDKLDAIDRKIDRELVQIERKIDGVSWRVNSHSDRLNGNASKNREQDKKISDLKTKVVILDAMSTYEPKGYGK